jgi:hypothetical protein
VNGLAFSAGHALEQRNTLHVTDVRGETYLSRINCEYRDYLAELCRYLWRRDSARLSQRARGLDHGHGGGRHGHLLPAGILGDAPGHSPPRRV